MDDSIAYQCQQSKLIPARTYPDVCKVARRIFRIIENKTKRRPYLRSSYFRGQKIFLDNFWPHLKQKPYPDQRRRLQFFECALEVIQKSTYPPFRKIEDGYLQIIFYRFLGKVENRFFVVQIKEDLKRQQKFFMSVFEAKK